MFVMTLGGFGDIWEEIPNTKHEVIGMVRDLVFIVLIRILIREISLVPLHCSTCYPVAQSPHCHDG